MKYSFLLVILGLLSNSVSGQQAKEKKALKTSIKTGQLPSDDVNLRCYYTFIKKESVQSSRTDTMVLDIGNKISKFYDPARLGRDSLVSAQLKSKNPEMIKSLNIYKDENAKDISNMPGTVGSKSSEGESYQLYKDRSTNKLTIVDYTSPMQSKFQYEDEPGVLPWKITDSTKTILDYVCQKATLNFRGRDYVAWFTTDIPVSDGPWKFSGLPGLILKVEDTQQLFSFNLIGLKQVNTSTPITINTAGNIKCTKAEFAKQKEKQGGGMQYNFNSGHVMLVQLPAQTGTISMELE